MKDRAGNTLVSARKLGSLNANPLRFKDFVGSSDREDLYTFSVSGGLNASFSGAIASELYTLKNPKAIKKIGKINFDQLKQKDIRNNLTRVARSSKMGVPQITATSLSGTYFLRVRPLAGISQSAPKAKANYSFTISSPIVSNAVTTSLFNGTGLPKAQGWLDFNQLPVSLLITTPFSSPTAKTIAQTSSTTGVTFKTDEDFTATGDLNKGYAGYSNYTATLATFTPLTFNTTKINAAFPTLDRTTGYTLNFKLAVNSEASNSNRAGFSIILTSEDTKSIELGFKSDRIFAQSDTFTESETATFSTNPLTDYKLAVKGDGYELFANNASILKGSLRTYQFNPATSNPPLPLSPYTLSSFLFLGDNTDQGRANVTLGAIEIIQGGSGV
jgi:hypothetical protein